MRIFEHPNMDRFLCPVCGTSEDKPVLLVGKEETACDHIFEIEQVLNVLREVLDNE